MIDQIEKDFGVHPTTRQKWLLLITVAEVRHAESSHLAELLAVVRMPCELPQLVY